MDNVFKFIGGFFKSLTTLLIGLAAVAVLAEVVFGNAIFGMSVVSNLTELINQLGSGGFTGLVATLILWSIIDRK